MCLSLPSVSPVGDEAVDEILIGGMAVARPIPAAALWIEEQLARWLARKVASHEVRTILSLDPPA